MAESWGSDRSGSSWYIGDEPDIPWLSLHLESGAIMRLLDGLGNEQRHVARGMATALILTIVVCGAGIAVLGSFVPLLSDTSDRLAFALRADLFVAAMFAASIAAVAKGRFFSTADIAGSALTPPGPRIAVAAAVLQNTLEQSVLAVIVHCALVTLLRGSEVVLIPVLVGLFCVGRCCFAIGYKYGAAGRAFGFGLTFYPTLMALGLALVLLVTRG